MNHQKTLQKAVNKANSNVVPVQKDTEEHAISSAEDAFHSIMMLSLSNIPWCSTGAISKESLQIKSGGVQLKDDRAVEENLQSSGSRCAGYRQYNDVNTNKKEHKEKMVVI